MKLTLRAIKSQIILLAFITVCLGLSACKKQVPEELNLESASESMVQNTTPDLNEICKKLKEEMLLISAKRTTFALEQINQDIRLCLPLMTYKEQKHLIKLADQMYDNFLEIDRTPEQQKSFNLYAYDQSQFPTIQQAQFEKLHPRDQYLLTHRGQAYIDLIDMDDQATYQRNSYYLAKVFAPYFPEAEREFMQELAEQNQSVQFHDEQAEISAQEIAERALFWESYLKKFPKSSYLNDAKYLYHFYSNLLFKGLNHHPISQHYESRSDISPEALSAIEQMTNNEKSQLSNQARLFMQFIELDTQQKNELINIPQNANESNQDRIESQLHEYLNLKVLNLKHPRDCFTDAICR